MNKKKVKATIVNFDILWGKKNYVANVKTGLIWLFGRV
jgi:hypothetical protein